MTQQDSNEANEFFNRDLSWLEFNRRVLAQATDSRVPLLERVRFLSIYSSNLDEFFMKRVGYLKRAIVQGVTHISADKMDPQQALTLLREKVLSLQNELETCFQKDILPLLRLNGIELLTFKDLSSKDKNHLKDYFHNKVFPVLTPLAVDPSHPFPFLSNLSMSLGVKLQQPKRKEDLFARIKIPNVLPQWIRLDSEPPNRYRFVQLKDLIKNNLDELFPEMKIKQVNFFRVTRNADIDYIKENAEDVLDVVEEELRLRRTAQIVRIECQKEGDRALINLLKEELEIKEEDFYPAEELLDYTTLSEIADLNIPSLRYRTWIPIVPPAFSDEVTGIFRAIRDRDVLVHHPYESFSGSVERFIKAAVDDPDVLAIKITIYRAGTDSPLIPLLIAAAEKGKQVVCLVELKARFDEARNIYWGEILEKAGVHVVYGVIGLKTHSKITLVVRREQDDFVLYSHIGTGNYNPHTAKLYTDLGLFTADQKINSELVEVFNYLTGLSLKQNYKKLLVSPINMRKQFTEMIRKEAEYAKKGAPARIIAQINSLEDKDICRELYQASEAGVKIDLIVRGFCCLKPGIKGMSSNIRVFSIVGRFLEHMRVFYFQSGSKDPIDGQFFIGSADWMHRNLNNRVEIVAPIESKKNRKEIWELLNLSLQDQVQTWELQSDGTYIQRKPKKAGSQTGLHDQLMYRARDKINSGLGIL